MSHRRIQEVNTALRESEQRYRNLVDTARDVILLFNIQPGFPI
jgi:PAS domain-containing protein